MFSSSLEQSALTFHRETSERWDGVVYRFEHHGNPNYYWCMPWRLESTEYKCWASVKRPSALKSYLDNDVPTGILGYRNEVPVGGCPIAL